MYPATLHLNGKRNHASPIYIGDTYSHSFSFYDENGDPIDKSGVDILAQVRETAASSTVLATFDSGVSGVGDQTVTLTLPYSITENLPPVNFYWDYQETESGIVTTRLKGECLIQQDVSRV